MEFITYNTAGDFLAENIEYLLNQESVTQLLLYNALNKSKDEKLDKDTCLFGKVTDENEIQIVFGNVLPFNLLLYSHKKDIKEEAMDLLVQYLIANNVVINGINANSLLCSSFLNQYKDLSNRNLKLNLSMDIMELRTLKVIPLANGYTRLAVPSDLELITRWKCEFAFDALGEKLEPEQVLSRTQKQIEDKLFYLFVNDQNEIVSMASPTRKLIGGTCINNVYTPKCYRNQNYAVSNMYYLCEDLLKTGNQFVTLFVDKTNPISNRVYKKIGFEIIEDCYDYRIIDS
jgi:predicted GNAT family acetyltransferase